MTLESLVRIVIEAVDKIMALQKLDVLALGFDRANGAKLEAAARGASPGGKVAFYEKGALPKELPDILFLDYIPIRYLAVTALGICGCPFSSFFSDMLISGKKIAVLGYEPVDSAPQGCAALIGSYYKMLEAYGVRFETGREEAAPDTGGNTAENRHSPRYGGSVLSKADLLSHASGGEIAIGKSVIVTDLAREEAARRNIKIYVF